jgi:hypothetical protein
MGMCQAAQLPAAPPVSPNLVRFYARPGAHGTATTLLKTGPIESRVPPDDRLTTTAWPNSCLAGRPAAGMPFGVTTVEQPDVEHRAGEQPQWPQRLWRLGAAPDRSAPVIAVGLQAARSGALGISPSSIAGPVRQRVAELIGQLAPRPQRVRVRIEFGLRNRPGTVCPGRISCGSLAKHDQPGGGRHWRACATASAGRRGPPRRR